MGANDESEAFNEAMQYAKCCGLLYVSGAPKRRIYSKELGQSGRFCHGYSGCSNKYRKLIIFDGEPTVELDYQSSQVHDAYRMSGLNAWDYIGEDPYFLPRTDPKHRSVYKALLTRSFTVTNPIASVKGVKDLNTGGLSSAKLDSVQHVFPHNQHLKCGHIRNQDTYTCHKWFTVGAPNLCNST